MKIMREVTITQFKEMTYDCDDFWDVIAKQNLWDALETYLTCSCYVEVPRSEETAIIDFSAAQDMIRYDGGSILKSLGANLVGTIWED